MSTGIYWELTCDGLVSLPGGVKDSHPLNITETGDERQLRSLATWFGKDLALAMKKGLLSERKKSWEVTRRL